MSNGSKVLIYLSFLLKAKREILVLNNFELRLNRATIAKINFSPKCHSK